VNYKGSDANIANVMMALQPKSKDLCGAASLALVSTSLPGV
jgi:hypothetical protein